MTQANDGNAPIPNSATPPAPAVPGWRIGVLYSRSGVSGTTESQHFFGTVLAVEEINALGGVLGRPLEPVVYDPRSERGIPPAGRPAAAGRRGQRDLRRLHLALPQGHAAGGRAQQLAAVVRLGLRRFQYSPNVIYTGAAPNQGSMQLAAYLIRHCGSRIFLVGADYIYPRETNRIMRDTVEQHGGEILDETYLRLGCDQADINEVVEDIRRIQPDVVFSTLIGSDAERFYRRYHEMGLSAARMPIASLTMTEAEVAQVGPACVPATSPRPRISIRWTRRPTRISWRAGGSASASARPASTPRRRTASCTCTPAPCSARAARTRASWCRRCIRWPSTRRAARWRCCREQPLRADAAHRRVPARRRLRRSVAERRGGTAGPVHDVAGPGRLLAGMR